MQAHRVRPTAGRWQCRAAGFARHETSLLTGLQQRLHHADAVSPPEVRNESVGYPEVESTTACHVSSLVSSSATAPSRCRQPPRGNDESLWYPEVDHINPLTGLQ